MHSHSDYMTDGRTSESQFCGGYLSCAMLPDWEIFFAQLTCQQREHVEWSDSLHLKYMGFLLIFMAMNLAGKNGTVAAAVWSLQEQLPILANINQNADMVQMQGRRLPFSNLRHVYNEVSLSNTLLLNV